MSDTAGLEFRAPSSGGAGLDGLERGFADGDDSPPAPPAEGMSSWDLADYQAEFAEYAARRILGTGAQQYDYAGVQKFEQLDLPDIADELVDELADIVNYATMLAIRILRVKGEAKDWVRRPF